MKYIDTHCHLDAPEFASDRHTIIQALPAAGISAVILPAISAQYWGRLQKVCQRAPQLHASYGLHPMFLAEHQAQHLQQLRHYLAQPQTVALGECGLDFFVPELNPLQQEFFFVEQLKLAAEFELPVIIHARRSVDQVLKQLRRFKQLRGVIHSFAGSLQQAEQFIKQGFYLGVGGTSTYPRAQRLRKILAAVPLERLVLETDAPDQPDSQWQGQRNTPLRLPIIAANLAEIRAESLQHIATTTSRNAQTLFNLKAENL